MKNYTKRQKEIILAAIDLIAKNGIQELTIKKLSQKIGVVESALYRHFPKKQDILLGILAVFRENKEAILQAVQAESDVPLEQLRALFIKRFKYFSEHPAVASVIFAEDLFRNDSRLSQMVYEIMKTNQAAIIHLVENGQKRDDIRKDLPATQIAFILASALRLIVTQWRLAEYRFDLNEEGKKIWETLERMVKN